jgi:hypothetical protein
MKQLGKLIGYWGLVALLSACRECPPDEIIGDAYLTTVTKEIVAFTDGTATYRNAAGDQLRLERFTRNPHDDTLRFVTIASPCESGWFNSSSIGFYAPSIRATYGDDGVSITLEGSIVGIEQPNPYDTVLVDVLSITFNDKLSNQRKGSFRVPVSLRNNDLGVLNPDTFFWITPYRLVPDTTLLGAPLTNAYYAQDDFNGGEVFITAEQGLAAFQIDSVLWVQD